MKVEGAQDTYLSFDKFVQVLDRLRLHHRIACIERGTSRYIKITYVVQYCFHQLDGHLGLLDKIVLSVFNLELSSLLFCRARAS